MDKLIAYEITKGNSIKVGEVEREWMNKTGERFAYRCLPMVHANEMGWNLVIERPFEAEWNGGNALADITITPKGDGISHFGYGILTFHVNYIFRTEPDIGILVTGPFNYPRDGIQALAGLVETDWSNATFTMNYLFTRPCKVKFEKGEPFCQIIPMNRKYNSTLEPVIKPLSSEKEIQDGYLSWSKSRTEFLKDLKVKDSEASTKIKWQKDYFKGIGGVNHSQRLQLKEFQSG